jgi:Protein of unknown function (DUF2934)
MHPSFEQQVRLRAYEIWLGEGMVHGQDWDHWHTAECELHIERAAAAMKAAERKRGRKNVKPKS